MVEDSAYPGARRVISLASVGSAWTWLTYVLRYPSGPVGSCGLMKHVKRDSHGDPAQEPNRLFVYPHI